MDTIKVELTEAQLNFLSFLVDELMNKKMEEWEIIQGLNFGDVNDLKMKLEDAEEDFKYENRTYK